MVAHGALGQVQRLRDLAAVEPLGDELGDIALALCEPLGCLLYTSATPT